MKGFILLVIVLSALLRGTTEPLARAAEESRVLPQLQREAAERPLDMFRVIVTRLGGNTLADTAVALAGGIKLTEITSASAFVADVPGLAIFALGQDPAVKYIAPDAVMLKSNGVDSASLATFYPAVVNASPQWSESGSSSLTGAGVGVAVIDTGIASGRGDWQDATAADRIVAQARFNANTNNTNDGYGHGTHVAGIIAGNSWYAQNPAVRGKYIGIAPEARLINVKVSDDSGLSYTSDVVNAIDWVILNRARYNIRVLNLSMVSSVAESHTTSILDAAVERAWFNGILVVVAAGNLGADTLYYPPANDPFVVTIGASDPMGTTAVDDDTMAPWSSYGITQDGVSKPDVVAPGRYIVAPLASVDAILAQAMPDRIVHKNYIRLSGTSMAAPVVAGVAALAFQAHPEWTNDQVKWLLMNTAVPLGGDSPVPGSGAGEVDAAAVTRYSGTPGRANQGIPISSQLVGPGGLMTYMSQTMTGSTSNWSTSNWSTSNWSTSNWSTSNWSSISDESHPD